MKRLFLAVLLLAPAATAFAADLPAVLRPALAPPSENAFDWSGGYLGVHVGLARGHTNATEFDTSSKQGNPDYCLTRGDGTFICNLNGQPHPISAPISSFNMIGDTWGMRTRGTAAGLTLGYNLQRGNFVYGVEGDFGYLSAAGGSGPSPVSQDDTFLHTQATDYMTARIRLGYAYNRLLLYATAGAAAAHFNSYVDDPDIAIGIMTAKTDLQWGYAAGLGAEFAVTDHITLKADWLHMGFAAAKSIGYVNVTCAPDCPPQWKLNRAGMAGEGVAGWKISHSLDLFRIGSNYKF